MKDKRHIVKRILIAICLVLLFFSIFQIAKIKIKGYKEESDFSNLRNQVDKSAEVPSSDATKMESIDQGNHGKEDKKKDTTRNKTPYDEIYEKNKDFAGWISIPDTPIDYPVMSTPKDPNFYLRKNFNKEYSESGTPFIGDGLSPDSKSFIVYAHHMKNKKMFGTLEYYKDVEYKNSHKYIHFTTLKEDRVYEVIGAFYEQIDVGNPRYFDYYNYVGDMDQKTYNDLIKKVSEISLYGELKDMDDSDQIMMLSTCSYFAEEGRFVVVAKRVDN